ncbi:MAG: hypothetical protein KAY37_06480 [Phycisphaerae bacterium]|nr:hypothetical protein [Phycisphaerae bacterium]
MPGAKVPARIAWVDVAKGLGMALVFYGHFVEWFIPFAIGEPAKRLTARTDQNAV